MPHHTAGPQLFVAAHEYQPIARARKKHVQHAQFLGKLLVFAPEQNRLARDGIVPRGHALIHTIHSYSGVTVKYQIVAIRAVETCAQIQTYDYRKFKALRFVHAHYAHHVVTLAQRGRGSHVLTGAL